MPFPPSAPPSGPYQPQLGAPMPFEDQQYLSPPPGPPVPGSNLANAYPPMPQSELPSGPPMSMEDLAMMGPPPDGAAMWGNPALDAPPVDVDSMFPDLTAPAMPLDPMMGGFGPAPVMDEESVRQAAMAMLQQKAQERLGASQAFQDMAMGLAGTKY